MEQFISDLSAGVYQRIVILTGAGISTAAGIPDFRSPNGIYAQAVARFPELQDCPEAIFTRAGLEKYAAFHEQLKKSFENAHPTKCHELCVKLNEKGWLRRVYTQNIDGLHQKAGLPEEKLVEVHGSGDHVVLFGDPLPMRYFELANEDLPAKMPPGTNHEVWVNNRPDLFLVLGTSLKVFPVAELPNYAPIKCTRVWITRDRTEIPLEQAKGPCYAVPRGHGRKISLKHDWIRPQKWKRSVIYESDLEDFAQEVLNTIKNGDLDSL